MIIDKQVKSAAIVLDLQPAGLAWEVYKMSARKHEFLICDNIQSIAGGALRASSIIRTAEVRIYNSRTKKPMDILGPGACGVSGTLSWSVNDLSVDEIVCWGRAYDDENCCCHTMHVICKDRLIDDQFHDHVSTGDVTE